MNEQYLVLIRDLVEEAEKPNAEWLLATRRVFTSRGEAVKYTEGCARETMVIRAWRPIPASLYPVAQADTPQPRS